MPDLQLDVDVFLNQHLVDCNCPRSFSRRKINARAALNHWLPIRCPTLRPQLHSAHSQLIVSYDHHMAEVAGLAPATRHYRRRHPLAFLEWTDQHLEKIPQLSANLLSDCIRAVPSPKTTVSVGVITTSLASLVKFLASRGDCSVSWIPALQRPAKLHALPRTRALDEDECLTTTIFTNRFGDGLTRTGVRQRLLCACQSVSLACPSLARRHVTPHSIRHRTALHLLQSGVDLSVIALWLGYEQIETAHQYMKANLAMKKAALESLPAINTESKERHRKPSEKILAFLESL